MSDKLDGGVIYSIIIPTFQRPEPLRACLQAITGIDNDRSEFEVVVVDDHSAEPVQSVVDEFRGQLNIIYHYQERNLGPAAARNRGAELASGDLLCFTDDDCMPDAQWLIALGEAHQSHPRKLLGGHTVNALPDNAYSEASQLLVDYLYERLLSAPGAPAFFTSNNIALSVACFSKSGGFDTSFPRAAAEDREFSHRCDRMGIGLVHVPQAVINHGHNLSMSRFWRQHFNYGAGGYQFRKLMDRQGYQPPRIEPVGFYFGMMTYPYRHMGLLGATKCSVLTLISQVANTVGFYVEACAKR